MTVTVTQMAVLIIVSIVALELAKLATRYFFGKLTRDDCVTKRELEEKCKGCNESHIIERRSSGMQLEELCNDMKEMKGMMLVVAVKSGIAIEDLTKLVV
jgi:hypothetical protein